MVKKKKKKKKKKAQKWAKPDVNNVAAQKFVVELISPIKKKPYRNNNSILVYPPTKISHPPTSLLSNPGSLLSLFFPKASIP